MKCTQLLSAVAVCFIPFTAIGQTTTPDISGEITTTPQAIQFALDVVGVVDTPTLRITEMETQFSPRGNRWEIDFRDGELTYEVVIEQDRDFDMDRDIEEEGDRPDFWQTLPAVAEEQLPETYLDRAKQILLAFNPSYVATGRALVEFETCDIPAVGKQSDYANGCRYDKPLQVRTVFVEITAPVRGEDRTFFKAVIFGDDDLATELTNASVSGNW